MDAEARPTVAASRRAANGALPDDLLNKFRAYRGAGDDARWARGDLIEDASVEYAGKVTLRRLYRAAAVETELSIAEIRLEHETARAADERLRAEFEDALCWAHFREVRYVDDRARRQGYLRWAVESADDYNGRPAPAVILRKKIQRDNGQAPPPPSPADLFGRMLALADKVLEVCERDEERALAEQVKQLLARYA